MTNWFEEMNGKAEEAAAALEALKKERLEELIQKTEELKIEELLKKVRELWGVGETIYNSSQQEDLIRELSLRPKPWGESGLYSGVLTVNSREEIFQATPPGFSRYKDLSGLYEYEGPYFPGTSGYTVRHYAKSAYSIIVDCANFNQSYVPLQVKVLVADQLLLRDAAGMPDGPNYLFNGRVIHNKQAFANPTARELEVTTYRFMKSRKDQQRFPSQIGESF